MSDLSSHPLSVDPTFNFGAFEVAPFTYRHLFKKKEDWSCSSLRWSYCNAPQQRPKNLQKHCQCWNCKRDARVFITNGETALQNALREGLTTATATHCFRHFEQNCKAKHHQIGTGWTKTFSSGCFWNKGSTKKSSGSRRFPRIEETSSVNKGWSCKYWKEDSQQGRRIQLKVLDVPPQKQEVHDG